MPASAARLQVNAATRRRDPVGLRVASLFEGLVHVVPRLALQIRCITPTHLILLCIGAEPAACLEAVSVGQLVLEEGRCLGEVPPPPIHFA